MTSDDNLDAEVAALLAFDEGEPDVDEAWQRLQARTPVRSPRRARGWIGGAVAVVVAALLAVVWAGGASVNTGEVAATSRQTVAIGHRGTAVVEAGGVVSWIVDEDGAARVHHSVGAVFYRVNEGHDFVVETPAGRATVTGTCFSLELIPMRNEIKLAASAMAGAAAAATVLLTVQEGSVVLTNDDGQVEAVAGQTARARPGSPPELSEGSPTAAVASKTESLYSSLVRENSEQRRRLRGMEEQLAAVRGDADGEGAAEPVDLKSPEYRRMAARECAVSGDCEERLWTDPSVDELRELAKCGRILIDTPTFLLGDDYFPMGHVIEAAGLSEAEATRYGEIAEELYKESGTRFAEFARELGVPSELVDRLEPHQLRLLIDSVVEGWEETKQKLANERAQLSTPPSEQSWSERAIRYNWGLGDEFERRLAADFGADAAREMRRAAGGWANKSSWSGRECLD